MPQPEEDTREPDDPAVGHVDWNLEAREDTPMEEANPDTPFPPVEAFRSYPGTCLQRPVPVPSVPQLNAVAARLTLTPTQRRALEVATTSTLVLVQGPPGTGKTRLVKSAAELFAETCPPDRSMLFTSRNHQAVDHMARTVVGNASSLSPEHPLHPKKCLRSGRDDKVTKDGPAISVMDHFVRCYPDRVIDP